MTEERVSEKQSDPEQIDIWDQEEVDGLVLPTHCIECGMDLNHYDKPFGICWDCTEELEGEDDE